MTQIKFPILAALMMMPCHVYADTIVASRTIRSQSILTRSDIIVVSDDVVSNVRADDIVGMEALVVLYKDRPISISDIGRPAIIERNQIVQLIFAAGGLSIATDGRSLGRAGVGDRVRVMNLSSRNIVTGTVSSSGSIVVRTNTFSN